MNKSELCGWVGIALIHGSTVPTLVSVAMGWSNDLPPISMVLLVWVGLVLFLVQAVNAKNTLYIVANGTGFVFQTITLLFCLTSNV